MTREFELEPTDNERLANLCGPLDENLRMLESRLAVDIRRRGSAFRVSGERAAAAEGLLRELFRLARAEEVSPASIHLALRDYDGPAPAPAAAESGAAPAAATRTLARAPTGCDRNALRRNAQEAFADRSFPLMADEIETLDELVERAELREVVIRELVANRLNGRNVL